MNEYKSGKNIVQDIQLHVSERSALPIYAVEGKEAAKDHHTG